jgi:hypothetical protein
MRIDQNQTPLQRVENRCRTNANGCWEWFGAVKSKKQQVPIFREFGQTLLVQRELYKWLHEVELPRNIAIFITCENQRCCNPAHLTTRTFSEMRLKTMAKLKEKKKETAQFLSQAKTNNQEKQK